MTLGTVLDRAMRFADGANDLAPLAFDAEGELAASSPERVAAWVVSELCDRFDGPFLESTTDRASTDRYGYLSCAPGRGRFWFTSPAGDGVYLELDGTGFLVRPAGSVATYPHLASRCSFPVERPKLGEVVPLLFDWLALGDLGVEPAELLGRNQTPRVCRARVVFVGLARELARDLLSYPDLARQLRRSSHSTAHNAAQRWAVFTPAGRARLRRSFLRHFTEACPR